MGRLVPASKSGVKSFSVKLKKTDRQPAFAGKASIPSGGRKKITGKRMKGEIHAVGIKKYELGLTPTYYSQAPTARAQTLWPGLKSGERAG